MSRRKRLRPWPPPGADLPDLDTLEKLSWGEMPKQGAFDFMAEPERPNTTERLRRKLNEEALPLPPRGHDGPRGAGVAIPGGMPRDTVVG